jgi:hypothetical protein
VVLGEVKTRLGVGRRGMQLGRFSRLRKAVGGRGVEAARWHEEELK